MFNSRPIDLHVESLAFVSERSIAGDHDSAPNARKIGRQALRDPVDEMLLLRVAADIAERQNDDREARGIGFFGHQGRRGFRHSGHAHVERINADRLGDVLELGRAKIADGEVKPPLHLTIGVLGEADLAGSGDALNPRGDIDAVTHQVPVAFLHDVPEMDADTKLDAAFRGQACVALDHAGLHLNRATRRVDDAPKLDDDAVACALNNATVMDGDGRIDQIAAQAPQPRQSTILVRPGEPAITDHIGDQDCCEFPGLGHWTLGPFSNLTRSRVQSCRKALKEPRNSRPTVIADAGGENTAYRLASPDDPARAEARLAEWSM